MLGTCSTVNIDLAFLPCSPPQAGMPERSKLLAAEWGALSEEDKQPFLDQAKVSCWAAALE